MKYNIILLKVTTICFLSACNPKSHNAETSGPKSDKESSTSVQSKNGETNSDVKTYNNITKIDLEKELEDQHGDYLVTLRDSVLQLVAPTGMYNPFYSFDTTDMKSSLKGFELKPVPDSFNTFEFSKNDSKIQLQYWETEELTAEYTELRDTIVIGRIKDSSIEFSSGVRFGMPIKEFFSIYFKNYTGITDAIKLVVAWEDERGESATVYVFEEELLSEIEFGNHSY